MSYLTSTDPVVVTKPTENTTTDTLGGMTTLDGAINAVVTAIDLIDASTYPTSGTIQVDSEYITYTGKSTNQLTGCTRGAFNSSADSHDSGTTVYGIFISVVTEVNNQPDVGVTGSSSQDGTLFFEFSNDNVSYSRYPVNGFTMDAGINNFHVASKWGRYFRLRIVNEATAAATLDIHTYFGVLSQGKIPLNQSINADADSIIVRAVSTGVDPTLTYVAEPVSGYVLENVTPLAASDLYDSASDAGLNPVISTTGYSQIESQIYSNVAGQLIGTWYSDSAGQNAIRSFVRPYSSDDAGQVIYLSAPIFGPYLRYQYGNYGVAQSDFYLGLKFSTKPISGQVIGLTDFIPENVVANLGRNVVVGQQPDGDFVNVPADGEAFSTTTLLGAGEEYVSPWIDTDGWRAIEIFITADTPSEYGSGIEVAFTDDANVAVPTVRGRLYFDFQESDIQDIYKVIRIPTTLDGFRLTYINGSTAQSNFYLAATLKVNGDTALYNKGRGLEVAEFFTEVALSRISNYIIDTKFGRNPDVGGAEDVWDAGNTYTGQPLNTASEQIDIVAGLAADASDGTGARVVTIVGLENSDAVQYTSEDVILNGINTVTSNTAFFRVNRAYVAEAGSTGANQSVITISGSNSGAVFATISTDINQTNVAAYTVPAAHTAIIKNVNIAATRAGGNGGTTVITLRAREPGGVYRARHTYDLQIGDNIRDRRAGGIVLPPLTDVKFRVQSVSASGTRVNANMEIILITIGA